MAKQSMFSLGGISLVALAAALSPALANAQEEVTSSVSPQATPAGSIDDQQTADIIVTGSRIARTGFTAPTPVTMVGQEDIQKQGGTNVGDLLNIIPSFRPQSTPATAGIFGANAGASSADLRGLGGNRTLVLVDGRRFVASTVAGSGFSSANTVDLNMIPTVLISRADVVTGGASAAYGSDAVAGVVNLVLDTKFEGVRGSLQGGASQRGDNGELFGTLAWGTSFADGRGHFLIGGEYSDNEGVGDCYSRKWCAESKGIITNPSSATNGLARQIIAPNVRTATSSYGGIITSGALRGTEFGANGSYFQHDYGTYYATAPAYANGGLFQSGGGADGVNGFYDTYPMVAGVERYTTLAHANYEVSDAVEIFAEGSYGKVKSSTYGAASRNTGNITIAADNAYLPDALKAQLQDAGESSFKFGRIGNDIGAPDIATKRETWRILGGARGELSGGWKWDVSGQYGRTNYHYRATRVQIKDNFANAVDAVDEGEFLTGTKNGNIVCRSTLTDPSSALDPITGACRPLNLFGQNQYDPAAIDYAYGTARQDTRLTQAVFAANLQGDLFQLPGGALTLAVGGEYRVEDAEGTTDPISEALRFITSAGVAISGPAIKVKEGYAEVSAPVLANLPGVKSLTIDGAVRVIDYSTSGSVVSWKAGGVYEPTDFLRFRVTRSRDIRAPNFFELYSPNSNSYQFLTDPQNGNSVLTTVVGGGNSGLKPEIANTFTAGVVLSPLRGLRFSADYFDIKLDGAITTLGGQVIVNRCAAGVQSMCALVTRDESGGLSSVRNINLNLDTLKSRGIDFEAAYSFPLAGGNVSLRAMGTYTFDLITVDTTGQSIDRAGQNGSPISQQSGVPHFTGSTFMTYAKGPFSGTVQARYVSKGVYNATLIGPHQSGYDPTLTNSISDNYVGDYWLFNLNFQFDLINNGRRKMQLFGVVNNLFDRDPPNDLPSSFGVTNPVLYDVVGRSFKAGVRFNF